MGRHIFVDIECRLTGKQRGSHRIGLIIIIGVIVVVVVVFIVYVVFVIIRIFCFFTR